MIKKVDHIVLTTEDFDVCAKFYKKLGFKVCMAEGRLELFAGDFKINVHKKGGELTPHAKNIAVGSCDVCFEVENLAEFSRNLKLEHISIERGIVARNGVNGAMNSVYVRDNDGNLLEFSSYE